MTQQSAEKRIDAFTKYLDITNGNGDIITSNEDPFTSDEGFNSVLVEMFDRAPDVEPARAISEARAVLRNPAVSQTERQRVFKVLMLARKALERRDGTNVAAIARRLGWSRQGWYAFVAELEHPEKLGIER